MTGRRKALLIVLAVALAGTSAFLWYRTPSAPDQDFHLELTSFVEGYTAERLGAVPVFDPASERWLLDGRPVASAATLLTDPDPEGFGPDSVGKYLMIRLPDNAGSGVFRKAIASLAAEGICQVAVADEDTPNNSGLRDAAVYRVVEVRDARGQMQTCIDRFNPRVG